MELDPDEVAADAARAGCEGITLLGGEPFDQPTASAALARRARHLGLGVITFTGRTFEDLTAAGTVETMALLSATDLLVDGPYIASMPETERSLVGSTNQRFIHLTDRYRTFDARIAPNRIDVTVSNDGTVRLAGFATAEQLQQLTDGSRMTRAHHRAVNCEDHNGRGPRR